MVLDVGVVYHQTLIGNAETRIYEFFVIFETKLEP